MTSKLAAPDISGVETLNRSLDELDRSIPWCHYFELPGGVETITPKEEPYYSKAKGLQKIGKQLLDAIPFHTRKGDIKEQNVLDLACGEGGHAIEFAQAGARHVTGVEGRQLYVKRSKFIAASLGVPNVDFQLGDVRQWSARSEKFDIVLCLGILHHLGPDDFEPMLSRLNEMTADTLFLYTHTAEHDALPEKPKTILAKFSKRLSKERQTASGYRGKLYTEHAEGMSAAEKEKRVRSSLDNNYSFWPRELSLIEGLRKAGFRNISRMMHPSPFGEPARDFRVIYVARH